ncbi:MAG: class II glutamine amidotransferase [Kiritimatiellae bacterium]|nr:class II glutamine amidotransferase [Kiritimatiellia bacterium]
MCEMLAISGKHRREVNAILREFFSHAERHPHGWGLARFDERGMFVAPGVEKEPVKATVSEHLRYLLDGRIDTPTILAHIRFATVGTMEYENCHPFTGTDNSGRVWTLVHNGTIFTGVTLNDYIGLQRGETDSERVLLHLIARIDRMQIRLGRPLPEAERFAVMSSAIAALAKGNKLNLLIYDGEILYAHTNFRDSLHFLKEDGTITFSTYPLWHGDWHPVPFTRLIAVKDGEFVREGVSHGNEYLHNPEDYRLVYMNFARL